MKMLVTGGAGFIGSNFLAETIATRPEVEAVVLDAFTYASRGPLFSQFDYVSGSILDESLVDLLVRDVDQVVHFAAETHNDNSLERPLDFIRANVLGTGNILEACRKHRIPLHHVSTDEVFGDLPLEGTEVFDSTSNYSPSSPYSASKASSDHLIRAWSRSFGVMATISNCGNNYGPYQHEEKLIPSAILNAINGHPPKIFGSGLNKRDWVHVDDHSNAIWKIIDSRAFGQTFFVTAGCVRTNLQIVSWILKYLGLPPDFLEFVSDRPGHDLRYELDANAIHKQILWEPRHAKIEQSLGSVVDHYVNKFSK